MSNALKWLGGWDESPFSLAFEYLCILKEKHFRSLFFPGFLRVHLVQTESGQFWGWVSRQIFTNGYMWMDTSGPEWIPAHKWMNVPIFAHGEVLVGIGSISCLRQAKNLVYTMSGKKKSPKMSELWWAAVAAKGHTVQETAPTNVPSSNKELNNTYTYLLLCRESNHALTNYESSFL